MNSLGDRSRRTGVGLAALSSATIFSLAAPPGAGATSSSLAQGLSNSSDPAAGGTNTGDHPVHADVGSEQPGGEPDVHHTVYLVSDGAPAVTRQAVDACPLGAAEHRVGRGSDVVHTRVASAYCQGSKTYLATVLTELYKRSPLTDGQWRPIDPPGESVQKAITQGSQARAQGVWICGGSSLCSGFGEYKHVATIRLHSPGTRFVDSNAEYLCSGSIGKVDCLYARRYAG